jgi:hypothetical protein
MQTVKATGLDRKSGEAKWRDLRFLFLNSLESGKISKLYVQARS